MILHRPPHDHYVPEWDIIGGTQVRRNPREGEFVTDPVDLLHTGNPTRAFEVKA